MSIVNAINLLQTLHSGVSGVTRAPQLAQYPTVIDTADLPYVITWPGEGQFAIKGGGYKVIHRTYRVIAFVEPLGQNDIPSRAVTAVTLLSNLIDAYITASNVALSDGPVQLTIESSDTNRHRDGGLVSNLSFSGKPYHGFEIRLNVRELYVT